jgi:phage gp37-like protein
MSILAQIEDAMIARIKSAQGLGYTPQVASYGGEFDGELPNVIRKFPAFWVVLKNIGIPKALGTSRDKWMIPLTFVVLAGARNIRGERETRHGGAGAGEVGVYQMLSDAQALLLSQDLGLAIDPFVPGAVHTLYNTKLGGNGLAVFAQEWHTKYVLSAATATAQLPDLLSIGMNYFFQPDDGRVDASDTVTLG